MWNLKMEKTYASNQAGHRFFNDTHAAGFRRRRNGLLRNDIKVYKCTTQ